MHDKTIIKLKNVSITRGTKRVLDKVDWETVCGQNWFMIGNNGSGKTTLLEILMGYLWPQQGTVEILGQRYGQVCLPELRRRIGYVSTWIFSRLHRSYSVEGVVASGVDATTYHDDSNDPQLSERVASVLGDFGCMHLISKKFGELSSGEQFKIVLCRSLINRPALLILDEPFAFLDIGSRHKAYQMIESIARSKSSPQIILVTHHLEDITSIFTHGLILDQGRIVRRGKAASVLHSKVFQKVFF